VYALDSYRLDVGRTYALVVPAVDVYGVDVYAVVRRVYRRAPVPIVINGRYVCDVESENGHWWLHVI
jgi:hypothetical protein